MPGAQGKEGTSHCGQREVLSLSAICEFSSAEAHFNHSMGRQRAVSSQGREQGPVWRSLLLFCMPFSNMKSGFPDPHPSRTILNPFQT